MESFIHPDDLPEFVTTLSAAVERREGFTTNIAQEQDGVYRCMFDVATPRVGADGSFAGFIGSAIDVTDLKMAQQELRKVSGQLIEAEEKERSRIARELHDDICQQLVLLAIELDQAIQAVEVHPRQTERRSAEFARFDRMKHASQHCSDIGRAVQALSHELHSSSLDYLGITAALRGFCREFSEKHQLCAEFTSVDVPTDVPRAVSLCLFRNRQEGLRNTAKRGKANRVDVTLRGAPDVIELEVHDAGVGFNPEEVRSRGGLGLVSVQERCNLVGGTVSMRVKAQRRNKDKSDHTDRDARKDSYSPTRRSFSGTGRALKNA